MLRHIIITLLIVVVSYWAGFFTSAFLSANSYEKKKSGEKDESTKD